MANSPDVKVMGIDESKRGRGRRKRGRRNCVTRKRDTRHSVYNLSHSLRTRPLPRFISRRSGLYYYPQNPERMYTTRRVECPPTCADECPPYTLSEAISLNYLSVLF